jgi:basic membrane lipoprotein Med (substrate-binding protein (PBP1-ABC) superfamily)
VRCCSHSSPFSPRPRARSRARPSPAAPSGATFKVALLTPGSIRDGGWNQSAYEGLERIHTELGAEIAHQETKTPQDFESGFRDFAARGFNLVFGHGFEFQDAAANVAKDYPKTVFVTTSGSTVRENVAPIVFELEDATYLLGFVGARLSKTGKLGALGGVQIPSVASTFSAFEAGAKRARGDAQVTISYIGGWTDSSAAREATLALVASGNDVLIHNANEAAAGFFQAVTASAGVTAFGTNKNQNGAAPGVLASATLDVPTALLLVAKEVQAGTFKARPMRFGLASGVIRVEWNDAMRATVPAEVRADVDELAGEIASGALQVPRGNF